MLDLTYAYPDLAARLLYGGDLGPQNHRPGVSGNGVGQRPGDGREVDQRGVRRVQRRHPENVGLELAQLGPVQPAQIGYAVLPGAPLDRAQSLALDRVAGDDQLA